MKAKFFFVVIAGLLIYGLLGIFGGVGIATKQSNWGLFAFTPTAWFLLNIIYYSIFPDKKKRMKSTAPAPTYFNFK